MKKLLSRYFPLLPVALILLPLLFSHGCANTTKAPSGGRKDTIPPLITKIVPAMMSTGVPVHEPRFVFTFDEYVKIKDINGVVLSPPLAKAPKYRIKGKSVILWFEEDLRENTTYTISFAEAIQDNNEGNLFPGFTYVFSTGEAIDSMMVTGLVQDCNTLMPIKGATVLLYKDHADSAVFLHRPDAAVKTDDWGFFCLRNIQDTLYRLYAIKDVNNNRIYDPDTELIAFVDSLIRPKTVVNDSLPEAMIYDMKDTAACLARKTEYELSLFREKPSKQLIVNKVRLTDRSGYITFMAPKAHIDTLWMSGIPSNRLITQFNIQRDSLEIWVNDRRRLPDTLHLYVQYRKTDTLGVLQPFTEHVKLAKEKPEEPKTAAGARGASAPRANAANRNERPDTVAKATLTALPETVEQIGFTLEFDYPIIYESFDSVRFWSLNPRQQRTDGSITVEPDTTNLRRYTLRPNEVLRPGYEYFLKLPHRGFRDINGFYNDSTQVSVTLPSDEKLSTLNLHLSAVENKYIVDLLDEKRSGVLRTYVISEPCTLAFPYLKAGKYSIRITEDVNRNSIVDSGSLLEHRPPEKVKFYKVGDSFLVSVPEGVEMDQTVNLKNLFSE